MSYFALDTSIYVEVFRARKYQDRLQTLHSIPRVSTVVLAELWRGVQTAEERRLLQSLGHSKRLFTPSATHWLDSGQLLSEMRLNRGFSLDKLRDLHFDILIALSARAIGATLITANRKDFEMIRSYRSFELEVW